MNNTHKIAIVVGGESTEAEVSRMSGKAIIQALSKIGILVDCFDLSIEPLINLQKYDKVLLITHGKTGEDGKLQGVLEYLKVPYTGSGVMASSIGMDKYRTKLIWKSLGIPVANGQYMEKAEFMSGDYSIDIDLPFIVKPADDGSSLGFSKVYNTSEIIEALKLGFSKSNKVLIESMIVGSEYTIPVMDGVAYPIIKIEAPQGEYDYNNKYFTNDTRYLCPCGLDDSLIEQINNLAVKAYLAIGASGVARLDFMMDTVGNIYFLEINTLPGMTDHSLVPMSFKSVGIDFSQLCIKILSGAGLNK